jgi:hypothetical protein
MVAGLVQQLFRQKVGKELDPSLVDEVLFPMLRLRKHPSKELLLDIKLTQSCNEHGLSAIVNVGVGPNQPWRGTPKNISPFEVPLGIGFNVFRISRLPFRAGKIPSQMRRLRHMSMWGSIDILNELRSLKHPQIRYHPPSNPQDQRRFAWGRSVDYPGVEFEDVYLSLQEQPLWPRVSADKIAGDLNFVNDYLENALNNGKRISWGEDPELPNSFNKALVCTTPS